MRRKLKVYGGNTFLLRGQQVRTIAAVTSAKQFATLVKTSYGYVRDYCCETGNAEEIKLAMSDVGSVFVECKECGCWSKVKP